MAEPFTFKSLTVAFALALTLPGLIPLLADTASADKGTAEDPTGAPTRFLTTGTVGTGDQDAVLLVGWTPEPRPNDLLLPTGYNIVHLALAANLTPAGGAAAAVAGVLLCGTASEVANEAPDTTCVPLTKGAACDPTEDPATTEYCVFPGAPLTGAAAIQFGPGDWNGAVRILLTLRQQPAPGVVNGTWVSLENTGWFPRETTPPVEVPFTTQAAPSSEPVALALRTAPAGAGERIDAAILLTTGYLEVFASLEDAEGRYVRDADATLAWHVVEGCGALNATTGASVLFDPTIVTPEGGNCRILADATGRVPAEAAAKLAPPANLGHVGTPALAWTGPLTVTPGAVTSLKIRTAPGGAGIEAGPRTLTTDSNVTYYAAGYDADFNFVGDQAVAWAVSVPANATLTPVADNGLALDPTRPGTLTLTATLGTLADTAGPLTVVPGALAALKIRDAADNLGSEVGAFSLRPGEAKVLHAHAYDADANSLGDASVTWSVTAACGTVSPNSGKNTTFTAGYTPAAGCTVRAVTGTVNDSTGAIGLNQNLVLKLQQTSACNGAVLADPYTLSADEARTFHAVTYDDSGACLGPQVVTWNLTTGLGPLNNTNTSAVNFTANLVGTAELSAVLNQGGSIVTNGTTLVVTPGRLSSFNVTGVPASTVAGETFSGGITVKALDADGNVKTDWRGTLYLSATGDASAVFPAPYAFTASDAGVHTFPGSQFTLKTAATARVFRVNSSAAGADPATVNQASTIAVHAAPLASYTLACTSCAPSTAGTGFPVSVTAKDQFGNTLSTGPNALTGVRSLTFSGASAAVTGQKPQCGGANLSEAASVTFTNGAASVSCTLYRAQPSTDQARLGVTAGGITESAKLAVTVQPAAAAIFVPLVPSESLNATTGVAEGPRAAQTAGVAFPVTVHALDAYRNPVTTGANTYQGEKALVLGGANAGWDGTLPTATNKHGAPVPFGVDVAVDFAAGVATLPVTLYRREAAATFAVAAKGANGPSGSTSPVKVDAGGAAQLGVVQCITAGTDRDCILASETVAATHTIRVNEVITLHGALFDQWDNLIPQDATANWGSTGTASGTSDPGPLVETAKRTVTWSYPRAGEDRVTISLQNASLRPAQFRLAVE